MNDEGKTGQGPSQTLGITELAIFENLRRAGGGRVILADFKYGNSRAYDVKVGPDGHTEVVAVDSSNDPG